MMEIVWLGARKPRHATKQTKPHHTFFSSVNVFSQGYAKKLTKNYKYYRLSIFTWLGDCGISLESKIWIQIGKCKH